MKPLDVKTQANLINKLMKMISMTNRKVLLDWRRILLGCSLLFLVGCVSSSTSKLTLSDHSLVDKIWDVQAQAFIDRSTLLKKLRLTEYLLLGEQHDNLVHHQHQSWVIQQFQQSHSQVSVAFEMIDDQQGNMLARHQVTSAEVMIGLLDQTRNHWDYEHRYKDLFTQIIAAGYPIMPANLNRNRLKEIVAEGEDKLPVAYKKMLSQAPLSSAHMKALQEEIKQSHCNMLGDEASKKMVLAQRVRDAVIAHSLVRNQTPVKVLIAGFGHVRKDRGVPLYLLQQDKGASLLTIGFTEVSSGANEVGYYASRFGSKKLPFDFVWFTPQVERSDQCASLRNLHKQ